MIGVFSLFFFGSIVIILSRFYHKLRTIILTSVQEILSIEKATNILTNYVKCVNRIVFLSLWGQPARGSPVMLFVAEGFYGVHVGCAPGWVPSK